MVSSVISKESDISFDLVFLVLQENIKAVKTNRKIGFIIFRMSNVNQEKIYEEFLGKTTKKIL